MHSGQEGGGDVTAKISHWSLTAQARVRSQASLYAICGGQLEIRRVFLSLSRFPQSHPTYVLYQFLTARIHK